MKKEALARLRKGNSELKVLQIQFQEAVNERKSYRPSWHNL